MYWITKDRVPYLSAEEMQEFERLDAELLSDIKLFETAPDIVDNEQFRVRSSNSASDKADLYKTSLAREKSIISQWFVENQLDDRSWIFCDIDEEWDEVVGKYPKGHFVERSTPYKEACDLYFSKLGTDEYHQDVFPIDMVQFPNHHYLVFVRGETAFLSRLAIDGPLNRLCDMSATDAEGNRISVPICDWKRKWRVSIP